MYIDNNKYLKVKELEKFGVTAVYTRKSLGDIREKETQDRIIKILNTKGKIIYSGYQTHSDNIVVIDDCTPEYVENTDGFITNRRDVIIFTKYADCLPIFIYDTRKKVFGCVHSGWKGSYKKIGIKAIKTLQNRYSSDLSDIVVAFGIGITARNYEVGERFVKDFKDSFSPKELEGVFIEECGKYFFDNQKFNYNLMLKIGIKRENIVVNEYCTYEGDFHSYRREGESSGRNGAFIYIE